MSRAARTSSDTTKIRGAAGPASPVGVGIGVAVPVPSVATAAVAAFTVTVAAGALMRVSSDS
jgi:hypothetical protein